MSEIWDDQVQNQGAMVNRPYKSSRSACLGLHSMQIRSSPRGASGASLGVFAAATAAVISGPEFV